MLIQTQQLNHQQLTDLDALIDSCKRKDGNICAIYKHLLSQARPLPSNLLYYHKNQLIGFLSAYFFYADACEIAIMVHPSFRRHSIAKQLLQHIRPLLQEQQMQTLLFSTPNDSLKDWLNAKGFTYENSEYQMQRLSPEPIALVSQALSVHSATPADLSALCAIDEACFSSHAAYVSERMQYILGDSNYKILIAKKGGESIGKVHLNWHPDKVRLTDIGILPKDQRRGFGSEMLAHCINYCLSENQKNLYLDVESSNQHALKLYLRLGFIVSNAYDFWSISYDKINVL